MPSPIYMTELTQTSINVERPHPHKALILAGATLTAALVMVLVGSPFGWATIALISILMLVVTVKVWRLTLRDSLWLAFVLMFLQLSDDFFFLNTQIRPIINYGLALLFCLPAVPALWKVWKVRRSGFRLYLLFCLWCLISISYSISPEFSIARLARGTVFFAAITLCSLAARRAGDVKPLIRAMMLAAIVVTMLNAGAVILPRSITFAAHDEGVTDVQNTAGDSANYDDGVQRFQGLYKGPNEIGALALATIGLILVYLEFADRRERIILTSIAILAFGLDVMADSRSDLVGLAIGSTLYLCWRYRLKGIGAIAVLAGAAVLLVKVMGNDITPYIWRGDVSTLTGRTDIWRFALRQIAAKPLTGYGWGVGGAILSSKYFPLWYGPWDMGPQSSLHSGYVSCAVEVGIPAAAFWLFIILQPWVSLFRQSEDPWCLKRAFFFLVLPMLIVNLDESMFSDSAGSAGFLFMMLWALAEQYRLMSVWRASTVARRASVDLSPAVVALRS